MVSIALVDDNNLLRDALKLHLKQLENIEFLFDANNGQDFLDKLKFSNKLPDIVFMDYQMPLLDGKQTTAILKKEYPSVKVIILSMFCHDYLISSLIGAGAKGFLSKNIELNTLQKAVEAVMQHQFFIEMNMGQFETFDQKATKETNEIFAEKLEITDKQKEFLKLCTTDYPYKSIADKMHITTKTVDSYRELLFKRFKVNSRVSLAMFAVQNGLV